MKLLDINNRALSFLSVFTSLKGDIRTKISRSLLEIYHILPDQTSTYFSELNMYTFTENLISHSNASYRKGLARIFKRNMFTYTRFSTSKLMMKRDRRVNWWERYLMPFWQKYKEKGCFLPWVKLKLISSLLNIWCNMSQG